MPQGINIDITAKQLIVGVAGVFTTLVGLAFIIMGSYATLTAHNALSTKTTKIETESSGLVIKDNNRQNEIGNIKEKQDGNHSLLVAELDTIKIAVFHMRRDKLLETPLDKFIPAQKAAIRQLERDLKELGELIEPTRFRQHNTDF